MNAAKLRREAAAQANAQGAADATKAVEKAPETKAFTTPQATKGASTDAPDVNEETVTEG